jgi:hypothetical protein
LNNSSSIKEERPFESLASLMEDELFKKTIYVI